MEVTTETIDNREVTEAEAVAEATIKPEVTTYVINVEDKGTGLETVRMECHRHSQQHLQVRQ